MNKRISISQQRPARDHASIVAGLQKIFPPDRLKFRLIDRYAYSSDAGFYTLLPQAIVYPVTIEEIQMLFRFASDNRTSVTFRTAGTSLSGQTVTDGILADLSRHWPGAKVEDGGRQVRVAPGITGSMVNHLLRPYGRKIGPDPASIQSAMMGGILSNNSSGMCCGVVNNSYHTLAHIRFVTPGGHIFDTSRKEDYRRLESELPGLYWGIDILRSKILQDTALTGKIRSKYRMKNTVGYSLNAFIDFEHPLDVLAHLLIGAEGTLAFIAEAVLRTIPDHPCKSTGLLIFSSPREACMAVPALKESGAMALEFMDRAAIRSIEDMDHAPLFLKTLHGNAACILCEYQAATVAELEDKMLAAQTCLSSLPVVFPFAFTTDPLIQGDYWKLRKGMYPSVAALRAKGNSVMLEDVAVPVEKLGEAIEALQELFLRHGYTDAIVFGHAKEGNLHFLVSQSIATDADIRLFGAFNDDLAELIINRFGGALKAEHGTGRQIAPYVETEWGSFAYSIMKELKALVDPDNILNPGVILNEDKGSHLKNLKSLPVIEEEVDKCVECGYCEQQCPSREYTLTPRQRIVLRRSLARLKEAGDERTYQLILESYQHDGLDTCAVDGLCATHCPVDINTGDLVKRLRKENHSPADNALALKVARRFAMVEAALKFGLRSGNIVNRLFGRNTMYRLSGIIRKIIPGFPVWSRQLTGPPVMNHSTPADRDAPVGPRSTEHDASAPPRSAERDAATVPRAIYFVSCINRVMGKDIEKKDSIIDVARRLAGKANIRLFIPPHLAGHCCGQPFSSKGFTPAYRYAANKTIAALWKWSEGGRIPVMTDISSCTFTLHNCRAHLEPENQKKFDQLTIRDSLDFATDMLLPRLHIGKKKAKAVFHPVCALHKMNLHKNLVQLGSRTCEEPLIPFTAGCCGMAGDRGFYYPGLIQSASRKEAEEVNQWEGAAHYSTGRTCEMAMSEVSGKQYRSIFYLLDEVSEPRPSPVVEISEPGEIATSAG